MRSSKNAASGWNGTCRDFRSELSEIFFGRNERSLEKETIRMDEKRYWTISEVSSHPYPYPDIYRTDIRGNTQ